MGLSIGNKEYFYIKDILENIIGIIDQEGNVVVYYRYDAYGKLLQEDIRINNLASRQNDILYKGYVYDRESYLYYLKSRYYNPRLGRFISMDEVSYVNPKDINGLNLYAYCNNNPIMYYDPSGSSFKKLQKKLIKLRHKIWGYITGVKSSKKLYKNNTVSHDIIENGVYIEKVKGKNDKIENIFITDKTTGEHLGEFNFINQEFHIENSYTYSKEEMKIICDAISEYYGENGIEVESEQLYNEWIAHNYAYYYFTYVGDGIVFNQGYKFIFGESLVEKTKHVDFGAKEESGDRGDFMKWIRILADS